MHWFQFVQIAYVIILVLVCIRIIYDTRNTTKALGYLLIVVFLPVIGILIYFSFGINYRKRKMYSKKLLLDEALAAQLRDEILQYSRNTFHQHREIVASNAELARLLVRDSLSPLTTGNSVKLLVNGENKFPEVYNAIAAARHHVHIEYYIYEDDDIGRSLATLLMQKAREGVTVRFIYDDFGSRSIRRRLVKELRAAGVQAYPFYELTFIAFANRANYRNHRKIIVIDGNTGFVGGINVSDRYINHRKGRQLYWRDTHLRIDGPGVLYLQYLFICDWNFCAGDTLRPDAGYFPSLSYEEVKDGKVVQIAASGPDSDRPTILFSLLQAINLATTELLIATPYFIPDDSLLNALLVAALGGVQVKLLVPGVSDSIFVNAAARSYYTDLLRAGVEVYRYKKGFLHAKTLVADKKITIVGTANMDHRSFDLNFEVNAIVYDEAFANASAAIFYEDLKDAEKLDYATWSTRPFLNKLGERTARLLSPLL